MLPDLSIPAFSVFVSNFQQLIDSQGVGLRQWQVWSQAKIPPRTHPTRVGKTYMLLQPDFISVWQWCKDNASLRDCAQDKGESVLTMPDNMTNRNWDWWFPQIKGLMVYGTYTLWIELTGRGYILQFDSLYNLLHWCERTLEDLMRSFVVITATIKVFIQTQQILGNYQWQR